MEECPKCKQWTLSYEIDSMRCYNNNCHYERKECITKWQLRTCINKIKECLPPYIKMDCLDCDFLKKEHKDKLIKWLVSEAL
jgi:hypothetical protein